jgi:4-amino-4-deoxy-L-arabinose transferase-like glycosyltransferase
VALPFVVAVIVLSRHHWAPVLDMAMTEFRVRDVGGRYTPLIGLPGRIGHFPDQGSHPGPLSFYLLAPIYRLFGARSFGLLAGAAVVNVAAAWTALWIAGRRGGRRLQWGVAAFVMVALAWFGASVLTQPWNPYLPLVSFLVVLLATWSVLDGDHRMLIPQVVAGTLCAQTHVPYLLLSVVLIGVSIGVVLWQWWHDRVRAPMVSVGIAVGVTFVLWLPVFVDQLRHDPGNITMLRRHFLNPPEPPQGFRVGLTTTLRHFDVVHLAWRLVARSSVAIDTLHDLEGGSSMVGVLVLLLWVGAACWTVVQVRRGGGDRRLLRLHAVVAVAVLLSVMSIARVFGKVWYYLSLWAWSIALLAVLATIWTVVLGWESRSSRRLRTGILALAVIAVATVAFVRDAAQVRPPEDRLGRTLAAVVPSTAAALRSGVGAADGPNGTYAVVWADAYYFGSQGYGLVNELERLGLHAYGYPTYHVPMTQHRITTVDHATAEVVLATGVNVARWKAIAGVEQVADVDPRTPDELARFQQLRDDTTAGLAAAGLTDLVPMVDTNLFGASIDPRVPPEIEHMMAEMLVLGEETAVFIAAPGTFDAHP